MSGSNQINQVGIYGDKEVPSQSNAPLGRYGSLSLVDNEDLLRIFGGYGYDNGEENNTHFYLIYKYRYFGKTFE
jgi:hypothetical protein